MRLRPVRGGMRDGVRDALTARRFRAARRTHVVHVRVATARRRRAWALERRHGSAVVAVVSVAVVEAALLAVLVRDPTFPTGIALVRVHPRPRLAGLPIAQHVRIGYIGTGVRLHAREHAASVPAGGPS